MNLTRRQKKTLLRILLSAVLLLAAALIPVGRPWRLLLFLVPYLLIGWDVLRKAALNISHGQVFDENFLMSIATIGALILGEYAEAAGVMLFYQVGELFQSIAVGRSRRSIAQLMDIRPDSACVLRGGQEEIVPPEEVAADELIVVKPGERIPLDGIVEDGRSALDTAALTGEALPRDAEPGETVLSGCVNLTGMLTIRVTKPYTESTVSRILDLVENAAEKKARSERFITRFARYYTPAVVIGAVLLAVIPSLITGRWGIWTHRALTFLVISCPCALVISVPLSFFGGIGGASSRGILVKGGNTLELLSRTAIAVFDKTGTLTEGAFSVTEICPAPGVSEQDLLTAAALAECRSNHPIAQSLVRACSPLPDTGIVSGVEEIPGCGIIAAAGGSRICAGSGKLMRQEGIACDTADGGTVIHIARDGRYLGRLVAADRPKQSAAETVRTLKEHGIRTVMLTGDSEHTAAAVAAAVGLDEYHAGLLPDEKVACTEALLTERKDGEVLLFVGDGINDAPVIARADIGAAMGALGSDAAIEAADLVLMDDDPGKLVTAMEISRKCMRIVRENIVFSLGVKAVFLILASLGAATMWGAVFADVGVAVIAILNAGRMLGGPKETAKKRSAHAGRS